jgi:hypothetical protein
MSDQPLEPADPDVGDLVISNDDPDDNADAAQSPAADLSGDPIGLEP